MLLYNIGGDGGLGKSRPSLKLMSKCYECRGFKPDDNFYLCEECRDAGIAMTPIACHNLSDGPGSSVNEMVFNKPDAKKDKLLTCKQMEESGALANNPGLKALCDYKMKKVMSQPDGDKVDYGEAGHPLLDDRGDND